MTFIDSFFCLVIYSVDKLISAFFDISIETFFISSFSNSLRIQLVWSFDGTPIQFIWMLNHPTGSIWGVLLLTTPKNNWFCFQSVDFLLYPFSVVYISNPPYLILIQVSLLFTLLYLFSSDRLMIFNICVRLSIHLCTHQSSELYIFIVSIFQCPIGSNILSDSIEFSIVSCRLFNNYIRASWDFDNSFCVASTCLFEGRWTL